MDRRKHDRVLSTAYQKPKIKYKLISKKIPLSEVIYDGEIFDLSLGGAQICGVTLNEKLLLQLKAGEVLVGCNMLFGNNVAKVLSQLKWFKFFGNQLLFGIEFVQLDSLVKAEIQKFLIKTQLDSRRFLTRKR